MKATEISSIFCLLENHQDTRGSMAYLYPQLASILNCLAAGIYEIFPTGGNMTGGNITGGNMTCGNLLGNRHGHGDSPLQCIGEVYWKI